MAGAFRLTDFSQSREDTPILFVGAPRARSSRELDANNQGVRVSMRSLAAKARAYGTYACTLYSLSIAIYDKETVFFGPLYAIRYEYVTVADVDVVCALTLARACS